MGEMADAMLNGEYCPGCGEYLGEGDGFPQMCSGCAPRDRAPRARPFASKPKKVKCPQCPKRFATEFAMIDHERDVHGGPLKPKGKR